MPKAKTGLSPDLPGSPRFSPNPSQVTQLSGNLFQKDVRAYSGRCLQPGFRADGARNPLCQSCSRVSRLKSRRRAKNPSNTSRSADPSSWTPLVETSKPRGRVWGAGAFSNRPEVKVREASPELAVVSRSRSWTTRCAGRQVAQTLMLLGEKDTDHAYRVAEWELSQQFAENCAS